LPPLALSAVLTAVLFQTPAPETLRLFNGRDLDGWTIHLPHADGADPTTDPKQVFRVHNGLLHVSGQEFGYIATRDEFEDFHLIVEFRWGDRRWPPRENAKRDSGICYHVVGPDKVWPRSIECQIQEGDCGDFWMVDGARLTVRGVRNEPGSAVRAVKTADAEKPHGQWNTIEVISQNGSLIHKVNGVVVNQGSDPEPRRGRILLQSEGAEIVFRRVEITPLDRPHPGQSRITEPKPRDATY
jgi:hypothetical protein